MDLTIGPNPVVGFVSMSLLSLLLAAALIASWLALTTSPGNWRLVAASWAIVATYSGLFLVLPHSDYERERTFLVRFVERTLEAHPFTTR